MGAQIGGHTIGKPALTHGPGDKCPYRGRIAVRPLLIGGLETAAPYYIAVCPLLIGGLETAAP